MTDDIKLLPPPKEIQGQLLQSHQQDVETIVGVDGESKTLR